MLRDNIQVAARNLIHRRLRSWLTMLGIFIGIAAIVSLISLGNGLRTSILNQLSFAGSDMIIISPGGIAGPPGSETGSSRLSVDDLEVVKSNPRVGQAAGFLSRTLRVGYKDEEQSLLVFGMPMDEGRNIFDELSAFDVQEGRKLREGDTKRAVIGAGLADASRFEEHILIGKDIEIEGVEYEVIGVNKRVGNPFFDYNVMVTLDEMRDITGLKEQLSGLRARPKEGVAVNDVTESLRRDLRQSRDVDEGEEDFQLETSQQLLDSLGTILLIVQAVVVAIALVSILVGGIGIMNTMYTSVLERTKEIGIMKAIGARNGDILSLFLLESGLLGLVGGVVGVVIGVVMGKLVEYGGRLALGSNLIQSEITFGLVFGALVFSFLIGSIAGTLPAIQASRSNPVEALRYE